MAGDRFPVRGRSWEAVKVEMQEARRGDLPWYSERMFLGGSYYASPDVVAVANEAYNLYINFNELFAKTMFPSLAHYEDQIVGALLEMLNGPPGAVGSITSGGTESIMTAMKAPAMKPSLDPNCDGGVLAIDMIEPNTKARRAAISETVMDAATPHRKQANVTRRMRGVSPSSTA